MLILLLQNATPWFSEQTGILIGSFGGAGLGLLGAGLGITASLLPPRGKRRAFLLNSMLIVAVLGALCFLLGGLGLLLDQPYAVWYPLMLLGAIAAGVFGGLFPILKRRYMESE